MAAGGGCAPFLLSRKTAEAAEGGFVGLGGAPAAFGLEIGRLAPPIRTRISSISAAGSSSMDARRAWNPSMRKQSGRSASVPNGTACA